MVCVMRPVEKTKEGIPLYRKEDFLAMHEAGRIAASCLDALVDEVKVGVTTEYLDDFCSAFIKKHDATAAPLNYKGFPRSICTSVNHVVCHGIPSDKILQKGDIVNVDVTVIYKGWHGDCSRMFFVGAEKDIGVRARKLVSATYEAMMRAIECVRPGAFMGDIGEAIESYVVAHGFSVVREFCGHGLGRVFHDKPQVLHCGKRGEGVRLEEGMFFTIEPMVNGGSAGVKILSDGWTAVTKDRSLSAQFEHSIGVSAQGCEIFTLSPMNYHCPPYGRS